jgi:Na+-transporting methylmalonyl-CoA/oxaloacetate decarboxylase gamma subunit
MEWIVISILVIVTIIVSVNFHRSNKESEESPKSEDYSEKENANLDNQD